MRRIYFGVALVGALSAIGCSRSRPAEDRAPAKAIRMGVVSVAKPQRRSAARMRAMSSSKLNGLET